MTKRLDSKGFIALITETVRSSREGVHRSVIEKLGRENGWAAGTVEQLLRTLVSAGDIAVRLGVYFDVDRLKAIESRLGQMRFEVPRVTPTMNPVVIPVKPDTPPEPERISVACLGCRKELREPAAYIEKVLRVHAAVTCSLAPSVRPIPVLPIRPATMNTPDIRKDPRYFNENGILRGPYLPKQALLKGFRVRECRRCGMRMALVVKREARGAKRARGRRRVGVQWIWETTRPVPDGCGYRNHDWRHFGNPAFSSSTSKGPDGPGSRERTPESASDHRF